MMQASDDGGNIPTDWRALLLEPNELVTILSMPGSKMAWRVRRSLSGIVSNVSAIAADPNSRVTRSIPIPALERFDRFKAPPNHPVRRKCIGPS